MFPNWFSYPLEERDASSAPSIALDLPWILGMVGLINAYIVVDGVLYYPSICYACALTLLLLIMQTSFV